MSEEHIYDTYAPIYDTTRQGRFGGYLAELALNWLRLRGFTPQRALDIACGTGGATLALATAGVATVGLDRSPAMLRIAHGRARDAGLAVKFVEADMRELGMVNWELRNSLDGDLIQTGQPQTVSIEPYFPILNSQFSILTCFGDSLNYVTNDGDLERVFAGVAGLAAPEGYFVFDVNTEAAFARWDDRDVVTYDGDDCLVYNRLEFHPTNRLGRGRIVWFVRGDDQRWWRGEEIHIERAWSDAEIRAALAGNGFDLAARLDVEGRTVADDDGLPDRLIYLAKRGLSEASR